MRPIGTIAPLLFLIAATAVAQPAAPTNFGAVPFGGEDVTCARCIVAEHWHDAPAAVGSHGFEGFSWPVRRQLNDGIVLVNYVDDEPSNLVRDYMGAPHSYNGHRGTDLTLYSFRSMDRGVPIIAAAPGTVMGTIYNHPDRNIGPPYPDSGNGIWIQHDDGVVSYYWHPRTNSVAVEPGEHVETGQFLAFAGSSGYSTDAHLHFEVQEERGSTTVVRDPWMGSNNPLPSLWIEQPGYIGYDSLRIFDIGFTTKGGAGGDFHVVTPGALKERLPQPLTLGLDEPQIGVWFLLQGQVEEEYTVRLYKPDSTAYAEATYALGGKSQYAFNYWYWNLAGLSASDEGNWWACVTEGDKELARLVIPVSEETVFPPRFSPVAGRSLRIETETVRDTLRVSPLGKPVSFRLDVAPASVSLTDSIVTITPPSTQEYRSLFFNAIAEDEDGRTDTMRYHLVDPTRPLDPIPVSVESSPLPAAPQLMHLYPNPAIGETNAVLHTDDGGILEVRVYDAIGRLALPPIRSTTLPGSRTIPIQLGSLASGVYLVRATGAGLERTTMLIVAR